MTGLVFFKLLGIFLMLVELWWFIGRPIGRELAEWWRARGRVGLTVNFVATCACAAGLAALAAPLAAGSLMSV